MSQARAELCGALLELLGQSSDHLFLLAHKELEGPHIQLELRAHFFALPRRLPRNLRPHGRPKRLQALLQDELITHQGRVLTL